MTEYEFYYQGNLFLTELLKDLKSKNIEFADHWDVDHICFRSEGQEDYLSLKESFSGFGDLLIESEVNGRLISTFKLHRPLIMNDWQIQLVELPAPKAGKIVERGFEHIEIVFDLPFKEFQERHKHLVFDDKGLGKIFNKELEVCLGKRNIKFHHSSLESVINIEKNTRVWKALKESNILEVLKEYYPLIAGAFPLGMESAHSDLDILLCSKDFGEVENLLKKTFSNYKSFKIIFFKMDQFDSLLCSFFVNDLLVEVFVQETEAVKQTAYRHFLIEERLLKLGGPNLRDAVRSGRKQGLKMEHAFAEVLKIEGDPYLKLLEFQNYSNGQLLNLLSKNIQG